MYREIIKELDHLRISRGIEIKELAKMSGLSGTTLRVYFDFRQKSYTYDVVKKIADALGSEIEIPKDIIQCPMCGSLFERTDLRNFYCSIPCRELASKSNKRPYISKPKQVKIKPCNKKTLDDILKEAQEHNMSYGKYVSMMEVKWNRL